MKSLHQLKKLYLGKYQYKIVLVCPGIYCFRGNNHDYVDARLNSYFSSLDPKYKNTTRVIDQEKYLYDLQNCLKTLTDFTRRVENPYLSIYTNNYADIKTIESIDKSRVSKIYEVALPIKTGEIISTLPYDYKVYVKIFKNTDYSGFLNWAINNKNVRIPKSTISDMTHNLSYQPRYFYIKGEKQLNFAKIHLSSITSIEKIVNP